MSREVYVYADWEEFNTPTLIGALRSDVVKRKEHFSFVYDISWLESSYAQQIDPELQLYAGAQHSAEQHNFRSFLDSCPDRWGRLLMKRREAVIARINGDKPRVLNEIDFLLGVHDMHRMGALRFKTDKDGDFLDNNQDLAAPTISCLHELEYAAQRIEGDGNLDDPDYAKWLNMLISPGSSLGGARPKACVVDDDGALWIAKFPSNYDDNNIAAWEFVTYKLALAAGINMSECRLEKFNHRYHTFLTRRFDRSAKSRLQFTSAMTQLGYYDGDYDASYLELAQFLTDQGSDTKADLEQLWRRIVFNIAVSNTDDHLRNHGFIYHKGGWLLSPAYDINPVTPASGLHLNITDDDNSLDYDIAMSVIDFFQLSQLKAEQIRNEILNAVSHWENEATKVGLSRGEQQQMAAAFNV